MSATTNESTLKPVNDAAGEKYGEGGMQPNGQERHTSKAAFFEAKYRKAEDPWGFASRPSELLRYDRIVAALDGRRYRRAFEPGCSVGVLTERLAGLCDAVEALDFSPTAAAAAQARCAGLPQVTVHCDSLPARLPSAETDLLVLSEIGYYFSATAFRELLHTLIAPLSDGATVLAAHWLGYSEDHVLSGDEVHAVLRAEPALRLEHTERYPGFRLDRFRLMVDQTEHRQVLR